MFLAVSKAICANFAGSLALGAFAGRSILGRVDEILALFAASIPFAVVFVGRLHACDLTIHSAKTYK